MSSVSCCTICNSISLFPSRPIPHHPTSSHLSHHSYIFISLGFRMALGCELKLGIFEIVSDIYDKGRLKGISDDLYC